MPDDNHISIFPVTSLACNQRRPFTLGPWKNPDCCFLKRAARVREPHKREGCKVDLSDLCRPVCAREASLRRTVNNTFMCVPLCCVLGRVYSLCVCLCVEGGKKKKSSPSKATPQDSVRERQLTHLIFLTCRGPPPQSDMCNDATCSIRKRGLGPTVLWTRLSKYSNNTST